MNNITGEHQEPGTEGRTWPLPCTLKQSSGFTKKWSHDPQGRIQTCCPHTARVMLSYTCLIGQQAMISYVLISNLELSISYQGDDQRKSCCRI